VHGNDSTATAFFASPESAANERRFRIYRRNSPLTLAELLPFLDQLGLQAIDERPYALQLGDDTISLYDVGVRVDDAASVTSETLDEVRRAFHQLLAGAIESDGFNRLVLKAGLDVRGVEILRTYAKYLRQTSFPFSQQYVEATLTKYPAVAALLVELFRARHDPSVADETREQRRDDIQRRLDDALEAIPSLDEDRICRTLGDVINATCARTRFGPPMAAARVRSSPSSSIRHGSAIFRCRGRCSRSGCARRVSKACTCAADASLAAAFVGATDAKTSAPRFSA
jgi:glutamate dehydrogenase